MGIHISTDSIRDVLPEELEKRVQHMQAVAGRLLTEIQSKTPDDAAVK
jgi:hypothetical protein